MEELLEKLKQAKVVPVVNFTDLSQVKNVVDMLEKANCPFIEITLRNENSLKCLEHAIKCSKTLTVGAGTVLSKAQAEKVFSLGGKFMISPVFVKEVWEFCKANNVLYIPAGVTVQEFFNIQQEGIKLAKFFPATAYGGVKTLKAISSVLPNLVFMPTGGVNLDNLGEFLAFDKVIACGGSFMLGDCLKTNSNYEFIYEQCEKIKHIKR